MLHYFLSHLGLLSLYFKVEEVLWFDRKVKLKNYQIIN
jgi:hypothetical protein